MTDATKSKTSNRGRPGYDLDTLLHTAAVVFHERGYDGTSMEDLAKRLAITKSAIYYHVPSKSELLRLIVERALDALFAVLDESSSRNGAAIDRLHHVVRRSVEVLIDEMPFVTVLLRVRGNSTVEREALIRRREFDHFVGQLVAEAEQEGSIRPDVDPAVTSRLLFGMINSLIEWYDPNQGMSRTQIAEATTTIAFNGLRTPSDGQAQAPA